MTVILDIGNPCLCFTLTKLGGIEDEIWLCSCLFKTTPPTMTVSKGTHTHTHFALRIKQLSCFTHTCSVTSVSKVKPTCFEQLFIKLEQALSYLLTVV